MQYEADIPQLEMEYETITSECKSHRSQNVNRVAAATANNVLVTSLVALRKADEKKKNSIAEAKLGQPGHVCVVQAMVHQDAACDLMSSGVARNQPNKKRYALEEAAAVREQSQTQSIELTAGQARDLIKAIAAVQRNQVLTDETNWNTGMCSAASGTFASNAAPILKEIATTSQLMDDINKRPMLSRNDSFEGHEEAVHMLVDAVNEFRQLCCSKGNCEHI